MHSCNGCNVLIHVRPTVYVHLISCVYVNTLQRICSEMNLFLNRPSLTFSTRFYSLIKISIILRHNSCHSKIVFIRYHLVVVSEKNVVDENYENYSSAKLTQV